MIRVNEAGRLVSEPGSETTWYLSGDRIFRDAMGVNSPCPDEAAPARVRAGLLGAHDASLFAEMALAGAIGPAETTRLFGAVVQGRRAEDMAKLYGVLPGSEEFDEALRAYNRANLQRLAGIYRDVRREELLAALPSQFDPLDSRVRGVVEQLLEINVELTEEELLEVLRSY